MVDSYGRECVVVIEGIEDEKAAFAWAFRSPATVGEFVSQISSARGVTISRVPFGDQAERRVESVYIVIDPTGEIVGGEYYATREEAEQVANGREVVELMKGYGLTDVMSQGF